MKRLTLLLLFVAATARAAAPTKHDILAEFVEFLAVPNLASDTPNIARNAAAIQAMFEKRGVKTRLLTLEGAPPIVVVDLPAHGATRTIAFYAHYDGQPVDSTQWKSAPWTPVMRDAAGNDVDWRKAASINPEWRLYARSSGDDKAPIIAMATALDTLRDAGHAPAVNLRFVFEGEEEAGSPHLAEYLAKYPDVLRPDAWILCDGPVHQSRRMQLVFGARGVVDLELTVYGPVKGLHDGHYGNWVPNPIIRLTHLIDSMRDENGRILIPHFYDDVKPPSAAEQEAIARMPPVEADLKREFGIAATEGGNRALNDLLMLPALNVRGIQSGHVGAQASNTIQTEAQASLDFRLVPDETPESVKKIVEQHIEEQGYTIVRTTPDAAMRLAHPKIAKITWGPGYPAARTPLDLPLSRQIITIMTTAGHDPVRVPTLGGSIPMYLFQQPANTPVLILPIANHDDNQHAANENIRLQNLWDGIDVYVALFEGLK
ncbi:MAG TPA: M20/M25/M40 family metallo-hydrolase [Thermoanaerobaculia bacterium]|jgi:acetylornithine deacetylase/succinyl-diaminopimelate desuccinylase-like protein|nr:M20/M25/M40 family metallo-hydrolase [Thermoanaerobaculia bacterium]